ncbi:MAG: peptidylprolyl isomerase [Gammaproteobacteria bacterium]|nr:peptidylprolyl isomerase [Gammaproteobacteria bacterium]
MTEEIIKKQKVVSFTYTILDDDGSVQEQSDLPMSYLHGIDSKMFPKVERELEGKKVGDTIEVTLEPVDAFGEIDPSRTFQDSVENVPNEFLEIGAEATFQSDDGEQITMSVTRIENGQVYLDGNHPYAGRRMTFKVTVTGIRSATVEEVGSGEVVDSDVPPPPEMLH